MFETTNWLMSINVWTYRILQGKMVRNHIPILDGHWMAILLGQTLGSPLWLGDSIDSHAPVPSKVSSKSRMFVMSAPGKIEWYRAWSWRNTNDCSWRLKWCLLCTKNVSYPHIYIYTYKYIQSIYWYITITATGKTQWYTWSLSDTIMYIILCICVYTILYIYMCLYMYMQYMQYIYIYVWLCLQIWKLQEVCLELGYSNFHGYHLSKPLELVISHRSGDRSHSQGDGLCQLGLRHSQY